MVKAKLVSIALCVWASMATAGDVDATTLHSYKHWKVQYLHSEDGWNACSMRNQGDGISLSLNVDGNRNAELQIYDADANYDNWRSGDQFQLQIDRFRRWDMSAEGIGNSLFVGLDFEDDGDDVSRLLHEIRQGLKLKVFEYGERKEYYWFSLQGSKAAANAIAEQCIKHLEPFEFSSVASDEPKSKPRESGGKPKGREKAPAPGRSNAHFQLRAEDNSMGRVLYFSGDIAEGFARSVRSYGAIDFFVIERSDGGFLDEAIAAGRFLRNTGVATSLHGECASACVELFAGGVKRFHSGNARFGIHAMSIQDDRLSLSETQELLSNRVTYLREGGVDPHIVLDSLSTPASEIRWLTTDQARGYGLIQ